MPYSIFPTTGQTSFQHPYVEFCSSLWHIAPPTSPFLVSAPGCPPPAHTPFLCLLIKQAPCPSVTAAFAQTRNSPLERGNHQSTGRFKFPKGQLTRVNNPRSRKNTLMRVRQPLPCHTSRDQSCCRVVKFGIVGRQVPAR